MPLTPITIEELRERLDIVEVLSKYTHLQKAGTEYRCLCPFHDDRNPSLYVNAEKGVWMCRVENIGGTVFDFVMRQENLEFRDAAELLANGIGCTLARSPGAARQADERDRVLAVNQLAARWFGLNLWRTEEGGEALAYLRERGLSDQVIREFRLGYAPEGWDHLSRYLGRERISLRDAEQAGLVKERDRGGGYYDRFRRRIMFPILDPHGRTVAFGGRVMPGDDQAKYLNSPESAAFSKRQVLYGLPLAAKAMTDGAIVVEGYMDVIALHESGIRCAVATLGTALTEHHLRLLRRHTSRVTLCYDADLAGSRATDRGAAMFVESGLTCQVLSLPDGRDPDEYVREYGKDAFDELREAAPDVIDYRLQMALAAAGDDSAARSEALRETVVGVLGDITDEVRQAEYVRRIADWWSGEAAGLQEDLERTLIRALRTRRRQPEQRSRRGEREAPAPTADEPVRRGPPSRQAQVERSLTAVLLHDPTGFARLAEAGGIELVTDPACRELLAVASGREQVMTADALDAQVSQRARSLAAQLLLERPDPGLQLERLLDELRCCGLEAAMRDLRRRREQLDTDDDQAQRDIQRQLLDLGRELDAARDRLRQPPRGGSI